MTWRGGYDDRAANVQRSEHPAYAQAMEVSVTTLRGELAAWIQRAREGEEVVVTDHGIPVVRMVGVGSATLLEDLTRRGIINPPKSATRIDPRDVDRPVPRASVSDLVNEQRREP